MKPREPEIKENVQICGLRDGPMGDSSVSWLELTRVAGSITYHGVNCTFSRGIFHFLFPDVISNWKYAAVNLLSTGENNTKENGRVRCILLTGGIKRNIAQQY
jgi:hypothetical protein